MPRKICFEAICRLKPGTGWVSDGINIGNRMNYIDLKWKIPGYRLIFVLISHKNAVRNPFRRHFCQTPDALNPNSTAGCGTRSGL
ncbi:hypothetical protein DB273_10215 [Neisseria gonorrhoeae]|nr:hypothetical protein E8M65_10855 [Neisseria gonorrhoeae]